MTSFITQVENGINQIFLYPQAWQPIETDVRRCLIKRFPLKSNPKACKHCHTCTEHCPMSLPVEEMVNQKRMENTECILCGICADGCKEGAITYGWGKI